MPEPTLSLTFAELKLDVAEFVGYGRDPDAWTATQLARIRRCIEIGLRNFYWPTPAAGQGVYRWSFLEPVATLATVDGTGDYDLPADFGHIVGPLTYGESESSVCYVKVVSDIQVRELRQRSVGEGAPRYAAVQPVAGDGSTGQRSTLLLWPTPDSAYNLTYRYAILPDRLLDTRPYPLGGAAHAETIRQACLAAAERELNQEQGVHAASFAERLSASLAVDMQRAPDSLGVLGDPGMRRMEYEPAYYVTYNGVVP